MMITEAKAVEEGASQSKPINLLNETRENRKENLP
jgi:hypothetical protein